MDNFDFAPDRWVIVEITYNDDSTRSKVLSGWIGSYTDGDAWRLSSGITNIKKIDDYYIIENESGSIYKCNEDRCFMTGMMSETFDRLTKAVELGMCKNVEIIKL